MVKSWLAVSWLVADWPKLAFSWLSQQHEVTELDLSCLLLYSKLSGHIIV